MLADLLTKTGPCMPKEGVVGVRTCVFWIPGLDLARLLARRKPTLAGVVGEWGASKGSRTTLMALSLLPKPLGGLMSGDTGEGDSLEYLAKGDASIPSVLMNPIPSPDGVGRCFFFRLLVDFPVPLLLNMRDTARTTAFCFSREDHAKSFVVSSESGEAEKEVERRGRERRDFRNGITYS